MQNLWMMRIHCGRNWKTTGKDMAKTTVKVSKQAFDDLLGRVLKLEPQKRSETKPDKKTKPRKRSKN